VKLAAAVVAAVAAAAGGASAATEHVEQYRNPTAGRSLVLQIPGMHRMPSVSARRPPPLQLQQRCVTRAERRRVVRFGAVDGVRLIGVMLGGGRRAVVLAHQGGGGGADLCVWMPYARSLVAAGYRVLAFDHRNFGSSASVGNLARLWRVDLDVLGAIRFLRLRGATAIVLAGGSLGGAAVIAAGAQAQPPVQGVISFAAPRTFNRVDALAAARRLQVPVLFLSAAEDAQFPDDARAMYEASASADKRVWIFPGNRHGAPVLRDPAVKRYVDDWIREHLPAASLQRTSTSAARPAYRLTRLPARFAGPIHVAAPRPANGRLYVVQRAGLVRVVAGRRVEATPFLDLRRQVSLAGERGLFSLAFHPRYAETRRIYVCYTDRAGAVVVAEYRTDGTRALPDTARVLVRIPHADSPYHNGGQVAFGPDGRLYVGVGDGGYAGAPPRPDPDGNAQNLDVLLGKIFALDVDAERPEPRTVAYGLRNPWRFSVDPGRNALIVGDVGWTDQEEIDYLPLDTGRLVNFGWSVYEGRRRRPRGGAGPLNNTGVLTWPVHTYLTNLRGDCSIVGGYVYRGSVTALRGRYVFGDYCSGRIWSIRVRPGGASGLRREPVRVPRLVSFGEDARGELYAVSLDRGRVYRFARR
jgi:glucose/arabinose dehydrogenase/alpha-beta hydrolase superfamily lysophospholipase